jgi:hypothetical protein
MKRLKERWKEAIHDPAWWATIAIFVMLFILIGRCHADDRQWYAFMVDEKVCIEVNADCIENAHCAISTVVEERKHSTYRFLMVGCPGMLADDYFYDFTFECYQAASQFIVSK